ncbi:hypothetical protein Tco_1483721 [Tanacetum coccineum]
MMQRLLPYGLQQYLPSAVATPIIELCSFFKQICSQTFMEADMLKAQSKVVDILCNLELIYPHTFFDIMIHLVIYLPLEALEGGPIRPPWMYPFERFMKKLKNYVRNKAKPEGSIAEGYVAEEALTFSSHYFLDVTTKINRPDRNVDFPPPTSHPKIDTYRAKFKSEFPNKYMKEEFPGWFGSQIRQRYINKDPSVSESGELFAMACGPTPSPISVNSCVVNCVRFVVHSRDERRTNQNSGICSPGEKDGELYYGQLEEILEFSYMLFKVVLFRAFKNDQYILVTQVKQCFYLEDMARQPPGWKVVQDVNHKKFSTRGVIVVENDDDVIHFDNSSDLALATSLDDLDFATLNIDDALPHDLADSDDEDLANDDDDDDDVAAAVAEARAPENPTVEVRKSTDSIPAGKPGTSSYRRLRMNWARRRSGLSGMIEARSCLSVTPRLIRVTSSGRSSGSSRCTTHLGTDRGGAKAGSYGKISSNPIPDDGTYDIEGVRSRRPANISQADWDAQLAFWLDPKNVARCAQNARNWAKSTEEMLRLHGLGPNTPTRVPYINDEIMAIVRRGKQWGHLLSVGRVLARQGRDVLKD